ncbi:RNA 2',3'-cyclic phosphodiesterase [Halopseudomonas nanhaiensis]|uniref:RNA 2',3'-cyclic phosphodiesterase n=1 Tax=Halopseudomonas nanhaiensis TaxID=2830842 RepID=UPI001CC15383|nr:RNA 2',3'-cyclic phosphodiesterase [Halopseudomonas nanhaiensis]UAW97972.1 RNA 2',3'-cyclic phosphodiesterase [Halopseudomonas nanhaiensis]
MRRLFIGIELPDALKIAVREACAGYPASRWQQSSQLHLTLRFLGQVPDHHAATLDAVLQTIEAERFELAIAGVGCFGSVQDPRVLWAGVAPTAPLETLHRQVDDALPLGLASDGREFRPHVTLARLRPQGVPADDWLRRYADLCSAPSVITEFALISSVATAEGSQYTVIGRYPLA